MQEVTESATTTLLLFTVVVEPPTSTMLKETGSGSAPFGSFTVFAVYGMGPRHRERSAGAGDHNRIRA